MKTTIGIREQVFTPVSCRASLPSDPVRAVLRSVTRRRDTERKGLQRPARQRAGRPRSPRKPVKALEDISALCVGRVSLVNIPLPSIKEHGTPHRHLRNPHMVFIIERTAARRETLKDLKEHLLGKIPLCVLTVGKVSSQGPCWWHTRESMWERNCLRALPK